MYCKWLWPLWQLVLTTSLFNNARSVLLLSSTKWLGASSAVSRFKFSLRLAAAHTKLLRARV